MNLPALDDEELSQPTTPVLMVASRLACYAALILFFELALIRYTAGYVHVFGFYLNFVLIATFLGMGVGLLRAEDARRVKWIALPATIFLFAAVLFFARSAIAVPADPDEFVWGIFAPTTARQVPLWVVVVTLFALTALFFVPLGALLGEQFRKLPALHAYSFDIAGSLIGILGFAVLSALRQPPLAWFAVGFVVWLAVSHDDRRFLSALAIAGVAALVITAFTRQEHEYWSPYYRINVSKEGEAYRIEVNGSLHQFVLDLDSARAQRVMRAGYLRPYNWVTSIDTALVVGSGTGNDLALLLERGARHIDAVEIDPVIADLGEALHVQQPYSDPRVHLHIDDARAFLRKTKRKYDVIVFGTLDSQTLLSGMSSVRLDNYVYTVQSFEDVRERLKENGSLILYHMSAEPYIGAKIYQMVGSAFDERAGVYFRYTYLFNLIVVAGDAVPKVPAPDPTLIEQLEQPYVTATDDWPYLYLRGRTIPGHYRAALLGVLLVAGAFVTMGAGRVVAGGADGVMFFMGAGFLLIETKSVTEMSLLFGSTWTVNLLVFSSILVMVLAANLYVLRRPVLRLEKLFAGLFAALAIAYAVPASSLLWLGIVGQWILGGLMVALPVLFAALIFSTLFRRRAEPTRALAYNLLGAIAGGVLEYSAMALGIKALYLVAGALYVTALLFALLEQRRLAAAVAS